MQTHLSTQEQSSAALNCQPEPGRPQALSAATSSSPSASCWRSHWPGVCAKSSCWSTSARSSPWSSCPSSTPSCASSCAAAAISPAARPSRCCSPSPSSPSQPFFTLGLPPVIRDLHQFATDLPDRIPVIEARLKRLPFADKLGVGTVAEKAENALSATAEYSSPPSPTGWARIFDLLTAFVLCIYFMLEGEYAYGWFMSLLSVENRLRLAVTLYRAEIRMSKWLFGQGLLMLILGVYQHHRLRPAARPLLLPARRPHGPHEHRPHRRRSHHHPARRRSSPRSTPGPRWPASSSSTSSGSTSRTPTSFRASCAHSVNLMGLTVLIALIAGTELAGVVGALVAVPTAALIAVLMDEYLVQKDVTSPSPPSNSTRRSPCSPSLLSLTPMSELTFSQPERRSFLVPLLIAFVVVGGIFAYIYLGRTASPTSPSPTPPSCPPTPSSRSLSKVVGHEDEAQDDLYVLTTVRIDNRLKIPLTINDITGTLTPADDSAEPVTTSAVEKTDLDNLYITFPALKPLSSPPLLRETTIAARRPRRGHGAAPLPHHRGRLEQAQVRLRHHRLLPPGPVHRNHPQRSGNREQQVGTECTNSRSLAALHLLSLFPVPHSLFPAL